MTEPTIAGMREILERAIERGELPPETDVALLSSVPPALLQAQRLVAGRHPDDDFVERIVDQFFSPAGEASAPTLQTRRKRAPVTTATRIYERRWKMLAVLSLSMMIIGLDNTIVNVALPTLQRHFTASASDLQWIVDAYLLVFAAALLTMGTLGDRYGRKRALQGGLVLFGGASAAVIFAGSVNQLIVLRVLMGLGAALIMPATLSIITNVFPREERGRAIGVWAGTAAIGIGLGPLAGGLLLEVFSWSSVFLINVPVAIVALLLGVKLVPDSRDPAPGAFDLIGAILSATALLALVWAVIEAPSRGWTSAAVIVGLVAAALLAAAFISLGAARRRRRC